MISKGLIYMRLVGRWRQHEAFWQLMALALSFVMVHAAYELVVRPVAHEELQRQAVAEEQTEVMAPTLGARVAVIVKDYEQEACFVALFWALAIMWMKMMKLRFSRRLLSLRGRNGEESFLETRDTDLVLPQAQDRARFSDVREYVRTQGYGGTVLYRATDACLDRFFTTHSVSDATAAMKAGCEMEADRQDTELALVRYLTWAIPSLGFIGTVRGISAALGQAEEATRGNIGPVTESLGIAFNSTFVALLISLFIMLLLHKLQEAQESLVLDAQEHCQHHLLRYLRERTRTDEPAA